MYAISRTTSLSFDEAVEMARTCLEEMGFGILCEIDVQATLREKLGIERDRYLILGACNPPLANTALQLAPDIGVLLPCNVVVYVQDGTTHVAAVAATELLALVEHDKLDPIGREVAARLRRVVEVMPA